MIKKYLMAMLILLVGCQEKHVKVHGNLSQYQVKKEVHHKDGSVTQDMLWLYVLSGSNNTYYYQYSTNASPSSNWSASRTMPTENRSVSVVGKSELGEKELELEAEPEITDAANDQVENAAELATDASKGNDAEPDGKDGQEASDNSEGVDGGSGDSGGGDSGGGDGGGDGGGGGD